MSQEWFSADRPFYLVQVFYPDKDDYGPKFRQFLYESVVTVEATIRITHPDAEAKIIRFHGPRIIDNLNGKKIWQGRAGDFSRMALLVNRRGEEDG